MLINIYNKSQRNIPNKPSTNEFWFETPSGYIFVIGDEMKVIFPNKEDEYPLPFVSFPYKPFPMDIEGAIAIFQDYNSFVHQRYIAKEKDFYDKEYCDRLKEIGMWKLQEKIEGFFSLFQAHFMCWKYQFSNV